MAQEPCGDNAHASVRVLGVHRIDVRWILAARAWADRRYRADDAWLAELFSQASCCSWAVMATVWSTGPGLVFSQSSGQVLSAQRIITRPI